MKENIGLKVHSFLSKRRLSRMRTGMCFLILFLAFLPVNSVLAQSVFVKATIDSTEIWIGDQTALTFEVVQKKSDKVRFPLFSDTIVGNLEIVQQAKLDTQQVADDNIQIRARYMVTSFEDSLIYIPQFPFIVVEGDTVWSNSLSIKVIQPFEIDTASTSLADIKPIYKPPFNWNRFFVRILLALLLLALVFVLFLLIRRFVMRKPIIVKEVPQIIILPHEEAMRRLDELRDQKLWQNGRVKEYHTELTDIIRIYIDKMFNIRSMEMTSDEILTHVRFMKVDKSGAYEALRQMLTLADLVKFAKWNPSPSDNELSLMNAYLFVNQTKIEDVKPLEQIIETEKAEKA